MIYFINNSIHSKSFEAWVIWNLGPKGFNSICQFLLKSTPAQQWKQKSEHLLLLFSFQTQPNIKYQNIFYLIKRHLA